MLAFLKLLHVVFIFSWMGSLLMLTRFLGYQTKEAPEIGAISKRIYFRIDLPSMILAVTTGLILLFVNGVNFKAGWIHMKLTFAFFLIVCDLVCGWEIAKSSRKSRWVYQVLHGMTALFLFMVLFSIYILKP
ncbi:MAG: CopD family protein [Chlamydiales bacterium]